MWHVLRAELAYSRPFVLTGLAIAAGVVTIVSVVLFVFSDAPSHAVAGLRGVFVIMAPMIAGFVVQAFRTEERRARMLMAGPLTPRQVAGVTVLMTVALLAIGVVAAGLVMGVGALVTGSFELESLHIAAFVGGMMFAMLQMGLLAQEAATAHGQRRTRAAAAGWAVFVAGVLLNVAVSLAASMGHIGWLSLNLGNLIIAAAAMVTSVALYEGRTSFTR